MARADIVKASTEDLEFLRPGETPEAAAAWVRAQGPAVVLVTDGGRPVRVLAGDAIELVPAPPVDGRGHGRGGGHVRRRVPRLPRPRGRRAGRPGRRRRTILRAVRFAVRASAFVCGRAGANPPTLAELGGWPAA